MEFELQYDFDPVKVKANNQTLNDARYLRRDEFYTCYEDIEKEVSNYTEYFTNKIVYCNCDDPRWSQFVLYFFNNFHTLHLKKLIATCYALPDEKPLYFEYTGEAIDSIHNIRYSVLSQDGDFRSKECIDLLRQADIIVTNPPFSLFREFMYRIMLYEKKFLILGDLNAINGKYVFQKYLENKIWLGYHNRDNKWFRVPKHYVIQTASNVREIDGYKYISIRRINWYTNLPVTRRPKGLQLTTKYSPDIHPQYDNFYVIHVAKLSEVPCDYYGVIGVPTTYILVHDPAQFKIVGKSHSVMHYQDFIIPNSKEPDNLSINGKAIFQRIFIRRVKQSDAVPSRKNSNMDSLL